MKRLAHVLLGLVLLSHVLLSDKPDSVNGAVALHVLSLGALLAVLLAAAGNRKVPWHPFTVWLVFFAVYFYSVGILMSVQAGVSLIDVVKFPYRMSNLFIALLYPMWLCSSRDVRLLIRMGFALVLTQALRDLLVGFSTHGSAILSARLWSNDYRSLLFVAALGFFAGWLISDWEHIKQRRILQAVVVLAAAVFVLKLALVYSRTVWFGVLPVNILLLLFLVRHRRLRSVRRTALVGISLIACTGCVLFISSEEIRNVTATRYALLGHSIGVKTDEFRAIAVASEETLLFGKGFGKEEEFYKGGFYRSQDYVHNIILQFLLSSGLVGVGLFLWGVCLMIWHCWRLQARAQTALESAVAVTASLPLVSYLIMGMVQPVARREDFYLVFALAICLLVGLQRSMRMTTGNSRIAKRGYMLGTEPKVYATQ